MEQETTDWLSTAPTSAQVWMDVSDPAVYLHTVYLRPSFWTTGP